MVIHEMLHPGHGGVFSKPQTIDSTQRLETGGGTWFSGMAGCNHIYGALNSL